MTVLVRSGWLVRKRKLLVGIAAFTMIFGGISCQVPVVQGEVSGDKKMSLGPGGRLTAQDLRIPIEWISTKRVYGPGDYARELNVDGRDRYYEVHVPPNYHPEKKMPVILVLHGGGGFPGRACGTRAE